MRIRGIGLVAGATAVAGLAMVFAISAEDEFDPRGCGGVDAQLTDGPAAPLTGALLVANQFSDSATFIDLATGARRTFMTGEGPHDATISPDGRWGVVSNFGPDEDDRFVGRKLYVIDLAHRDIARVIDTGKYQGLHDVAFRPGHPTRALVTAQTSGHVIEVDVVSGAVVQAIETRGDRSHLLAVTPDGRTLFTTNEGTATLSRLDLERGVFETTFPASENVEGIAVTRDGRELWVGHPSTGTVNVHDALTGAILATFGNFRYPVRIAISPDGETIAVSDPGCRVIALADPKARRIIRTIGTPDGMTMVGDFSADSRIAFASLGDQREVIAIHLATARVVARHKAGWHPDGLGWAR